MLPARAGKAAAMRRLAAHFGVPPGAVLAAGDSGNDLDMLRAAPRAVVVANASAELAGLPPRPGLHRAAAAHAAGVLEGIARAEAARRPRRAPAALAFVAGPVAVTATATVPATA